MVLLYKMGWVLNYLLLFILILRFSHNVKVIIRRHAFIHNPFVGLVRK